MFGDPTLLPATLTLTGCQPVTFVVKFLQRSSLGKEKTEIEKHLGMYYSYNDEGPVWSEQWYIVNDGRFFRT